MQTLQRHLYNTPTVLAVVVIVIIMAVLSRHGLKIKRKPEEPDPQSELHASGGEYMKIHL
jgi:hypothetical protein